MPIFELGDSLTFPPVELSSPEGILAVGGDLRPERLLLAYEHGIFPWYSEPEPILWWSPDPRCVLFPHEVHISDSMRKLLKKKVFRFSADSVFAEVISNCAKPRKQGPGTWITRAIFEAYCELHHQGFAHSIEVWQEGKLVGGLYGVSLGAIFVGESMFHLKPNASKAAFICLCLTLAHLGFILIDCQVYSAHLASLGAWEMPRRDYLKMLKLCLEHKTRRGSWQDFFRGAEERLAALSLKNNVKSY